MLMVLGYQLAFMVFVVTADAIVLMDGTSFDTALGPCATGQNRSGTRLWGLTTGLIRDPNRQLVLLQRL